jgi:hypothetical protein
VRLRRDLPRALATALIAAGLAATSRPAMAQGNYRSAPMGGRTTLLGGTGVVYGLDGAAVFMNPATALNIDPGKLSLAVNFYSASFMRASSWYRPGPVDNTKFGQLDGAAASASDLRFSSLPSSLCLFFRVGRIPWFKSVAEREQRIRDARLGLCFATTQTESFEYPDESYRVTSGSGVSTRQSHSFEQAFRRFQFGPTYSMGVLPGLTVGASLHGSIASHWSTLTALARSEGGPIKAPINSMFHSSSHGTSWQLHVVAGATYRFGKQSVGIAVEAPSLHVTGDGGAMYYSQSDAIENRSLSVTGESSFEVQTPARLSLGTGISRSWGTAELDVSFFAPMSRAYSATVDADTTITTSGGNTSTRETRDLWQRARGVVNVGLGAEYFLSPRLSLLGGLSTDLSAVPQGALKGTLFNYFSSRTNRVAVSFGVGSHRSDGDLIVGSELSYGWGDRLTVNSYQVPPITATSSHQTIGLLFVIAGSTSCRAISRAFEDVTRAVTRPGRKDDKDDSSAPPNGEGPAIEAPPKKPSQNSPTH